MTIPPWEQKLQKASLDGVAIEVKDRDESGGRNVVTHEWAFSDDVLTEDLGRKADSWKPTGYLWGDNYLDQLDKLRKVVKKAGPCEYVDPWLGRLMVNVTSWHFTERKGKGGWVDISLELVEHGQDSPVATTIDTSAEVEARADETLPWLAEDFGINFNSSGPAFIFDDALAILGEANQMVSDLAGRIATIGQPLGTLVRSITAFRSGLLTLMGAPGLLGGQLQGLMSQLFSLSGLVGRRRYVTATQLSTFGTTWAPVPLTTPNRVVQASNRTAIADLVRRTALVEAARAAAQMDYPLREDAVAIRTAVTSAIAAETRTASDDVKLPLRRLSAAVSRDLTVRGAGLASLSEITPSATMPAVVLAHRYLGSARRVDELLARNPQIRDPLLVPGGRPLRIVTDG